MGAAVDAGGLVQLVRDVLEETAQHPDGEGLVDRDQHGDDREGLAVEGRGVFAQDRAEPFGGGDEDRQVARHQHRMGQRTEHQRNDQDPEGDVRSGPCKAIACQRADGERDGHHAAGDQQGVEEILVEFAPDPDGFVMHGGKADQRRAEGAEDGVEHAQQRGQEAEEEDQEAQCVAGCADDPAGPLVAVRAPVRDPAGQPAEGQFDGEVKHRDAQADIEGGEAVAAIAGHGAEDDVEGIGGEGVDRGLEAHHRDPEDREGGEQAPEGQERRRAQLQAEGLAHGAGDIAHLRELLGEITGINANSPCGHARCGAAAGSAGSRCPPSSASRRHSRGCRRGCRRRRATAGRRSAIAGR